MARLFQDSFSVWTAYYCCCTILWPLSVVLKGIMRYPLCFSVCKESQTPNDVKEKTVISMRKFPKFSDAGISVMSFSQKDRNKEHLLVFLPWHEIFLLDFLWSHWEENAVILDRYMERFQLVEMKKSNLESSGRSGELLPLLAESNKGKSWPSVLLEL